LRMTRWSSRSSTFRPSFVHHFADATRYEATACHPYPGRVSRTHIDQFYVSLNRPGAQPTQTGSVGIAPIELDKMRTYPFTGMRSSTGNRLTEVAPRKPDEPRNLL
jgi:hypothetical protein